ncbi:MAG: hypothetical protein AAF439_00260 [Pseudomonadota bacterium]
MTETGSASDAEMRAAVETLLSRLEREHAWAEELRSDLEHTQGEIAKLLTACDAAIQALPKDDRVHLMLRAARVAKQDDRPGRPPKDRRYMLMLDYLAKRPDQEVRNAEIGAHLARHGLRNCSKYISCALHRWANEGMVARLGHGRFLVNGDEKRLRLLRLKPAPDSARAAVREKIVEGRAAAEARFEAGRRRWK